MAAPQIGGQLLAMGLGTNSNFIAFAAGALVAGVLLVVIALGFARKLRVHRTAA